VNEFKSLVKDADLALLNKKVKDKGFVDREHLLEFLTLIPTNDGVQIAEEVKTWLYALHNDPNFERINFPPGHIEAVLSDLDSYGRIQASTILKYKGTRTLPVS